MLIELNNIVVKTTSVRKYGKSFFSYGVASYNNESYDLGDPFPASIFPRLDGIISFLFHLSESANVQIKEKDFRLLFKGQKDGAILYSRCAEQLENNNIELI